MREGKGYEQFYAQIFDLAVAHLRLRSIDADKAEPLDSLSQALVTLFRESFSLARKQQTQDIAHRLDAARIQLDKAFLAFADLEQAWLPFVHLREANLHKANLHKANLHKANLYRADLSEATLYKASLCKVSFRGANLSGTELGGADLREADLSGANLLDASSLRHANLCCVKGLTKTQLEACKARGAIIDEAPTINASQSTTSLPPPSQSSDAQAPSDPFSQANTAPPDAGGSSITFSGPSSQP